MARAERPALEEVRAAAERIRAAIAHTPLVPLHGHGSSGDVLLKVETFQPVSSFKLRGVYNAVARLDEVQRRRGLSTVSAGNTAQALAWCAGRFGVPARSLMPDTAPRSKIEAVRGYGAEPVLVTVAELFRYLRERGWEREPYAFIHPWTDPDVRTGHATLGLEIVADCPEVESVFVPVGGGGLVAGLGSALRALRPGARVYAVEPERCAALHASFAAGRPVSVDCRTMSDGVAVPYITEEMYPLLRDVVDEVVLVSERATRDAIRGLALGNKLVAEGAGALSLAAALAVPAEQRGRAVCVITGGSIDPETLAAILTEAS